ncbi:MAG: hypothetical protein AB7G10_23260 [Reyranellaceae bacterium]
MSDEWKRLAEIGAWLNGVRKPQWENILIKTAQSYANASESVAQSLPKGHELDPGERWSAVTAAVRGTLSPMITNPIGCAVATYFVVNATRSEREQLPPMPQFGISPEKYLNFMRFHFNLVFIEASTKILRMQAQARDGAAVDIARALSSFMRSPFLHEPSGYSKFGTDTAEREIEAGLWAKWLVSLTNEIKLDLVGRAMSEDDTHNNAGASRKSDGKFQHLTWQRLKAVGAFEPAYRGGEKRRATADADIGTPSATYPYWLKVARDLWAKKRTPDNYLYVDLVSPAAGRFFHRAMRAYEAESFVGRMKFYVSPTWAVISRLADASAREEQSPGD